MAHPHRKEASEGHNAKLKRMTEDYGGADPSANIANPQTRAGGKEEGPEPAIGFGADSNVPRGRADRAGRKQGVSNPVATLKSGGAAKRAHGGRTKHGKKGGTHVNVLVAPQGGGGAPMARPVAAVPPMLPGAPPPGAGMPPKPPMGAGPMPPGGPMGGPMPGGPPMAPGAPGGIPPGLIPPRKRGGPVHSDEKQDKGLIHKILKEEGLERSDKPVKVRAHGGHIKHHMDAGAGSGEGRLEKIGKTAKAAGAPQAV